jgi:hypothetical protein
MHTLAKPQELEGIKIKDFTPEQRKLYWTWQWAKHGEHEKARRKQDSGAKEKRRAYMRKYKAERKQRDPAYKLIEYLRSTLSESISKGIRVSVQDIVQCGPVVFRTHIEAQFTDGMSWENYGKLWEIDHIKPIATFDVQNFDQLFGCFHYSNLRPRLATLNRAESRDVR